MEHNRRYGYRWFIAAVILIAGIWMLIVTSANVTYVSAEGEVTTGTATTDAITVTPTTPASLEGISKVLVLYESEEIAVTATKQVYYAMLKKVTDTSVKSTELIPAAKSEAYGYIIDISTLSASKECYIGVATSNKSDEQGLTVVRNIKVKPTQKKVVFTLNWSIDGDAAKGNAVIRSVVVSNTDSTVVTYRKLTTAASDTLKSIDLLNIEWKKGNNGEWSNIATLTAARWRSMQIAGATIYMRLGALNQTDSVEGYRYSKESKIKIAVSKAPGVKVDTSRLTVSIKNGMQFRLAGTTKWFTLLPFSSKSTVTQALRNTGLSTLFDPEIENTNAKAAYMPIDDLYKAIGYTPVAGASGTTVTIEYRTAATIKKSPSRTGLVVIPGQAAAPTATITGNGNGYKVTALAKAASDTVAAPSFEYLLTTKTDITAGKLDLATVRWSSVKLNTALKTSIKTTYTGTDGARKTVTPATLDAVFLVRRRGINGSRKVLPVLASQYVIVEIPSITTPTVSPIVSP